MVVHVIAGILPARYGAAITKITDPLNDLP
jgi:hypothetical protein